MVGPCSSSTAYSLHGVEETFRLDVMQADKYNQVYGWAALPNIPLHGQTHFSVSKCFFVLMLCKVSTTFKRTAGRAPKTRHNSITALKNLLVWMLWNFSITFKSVAGPCSPKHGRTPFTVLKKFFLLMSCSHLKTSNFMTKPRSPTSPYHGRAHFSALKSFFVLMLCRFLTTIKWTVGRAPPNTTQLIYDVQKTLVWMLWNFWKTFNSMAGPCSPKHGLVPFTTLKNLFVWVLYSSPKLCQVVFKEFKNLFI